MGEGPLMGPERLSRTLEELLRSAGLPEVALRVSLARKWAEIVGPLLSGTTCPSKLRGGVLSVLVPNHAWAQELQLAKPALLERIARVLGEGKIRDIRFVVGALPAPEDPAPGDAPAERGDASPLPRLEPGELDAVRDPETREILLSILRKSSRRSE
jgi:hypothetical protein